MARSWMVTKRTCGDVGPGKGRDVGGGRGEGGCGLMLVGYVGLEGVTDVGGRWGGLGVSLRSWSHAEMGTHHCLLND